MFALGVNDQHLLMAFLPYWPHTAVSLTDISKGAGIPLTRFRSCHQCSDICPAEAEKGEIQQQEGKPLKMPPSAPQSCLTVARKHLNIA